MIILVPQNLSVTIVLLQYRVKLNILGISFDTFDQNISLNWYIADFGSGDQG